jgi:hypothetical protein
MRNSCLLKILRTVVVIAVFCKKKFKGFQQETQVFSLKAQVLFIVSRLCSPFFDEYRE